MNADADMIDDKVGKKIDPLKLVVNGERHAL